MSPQIRLASEDDADQVRAIYAPFCADDSPVSFEVVPPSVEEMKGRIARTLDHFPWLVCEAAEEILGYVYAGPHSERAAYRWSVNTAIYIRPGRRRSGVGRALYTSLFAVLRLQGYVNAYAGTTLPNPGSVGLHTAMGFEPVGVYRGVGYKAGAWHDVAWWQLALERRAIAPEPPVSVQVVRGSAGWDEALACGVPLLRPHPPGV